jgi:hypothetical protein
MSAFANQFIKGLINPIYSDDLGALGTAIGRVPGVYQDKKKEAERLDRAKFMEIITQQGLASAAQGDSGALSGRMNDLTAMIENATTDEEINKITAKISQLNQLSEKTADVGLTNTAESILKTKEALKNENLPAEVRTALEDRLATMQSNPEALIRAEEIVGQRQTQLVNVLAKQKAAKAANLSIQGKGLKFGTKEFDQWADSNRQANPLVVREVEKWHVEHEKSLEELNDARNKNKPLRPENIDELKSLGLYTGDPQADRSTLISLKASQVKIIEEKRLNPSDAVSEATALTHVEESLNRLKRTEGLDVTTLFKNDAVDVIDELSEDEKQRLAVLITDKSIKEIDQFIGGWLQENYPEAVGLSLRNIDAIADEQAAIEAIFDEIMNDPRNKDKDFSDPVTRNIALRKAEQLYRAEQSPLKDDPLTGMSARMSSAL